MFLHQRERSNKLQQQIAEIPLCDRKIFINHCFDQHEKRETESCWSQAGRVILLAIGSDLEQVSTDENPELLSHWSHGDIQGLKAIYGEHPSLDTLRQAIVALQLPVAPADDVENERDRAIIKEKLGYALGNFINFGGWSTVGYTAGKGCFILPPRADV